MRLLIIWIFSMCCIVCRAQQFINKTSAYQINHTYGSGTAGGGVTAVDFNQDGLDDISLGSSENRPIHFYQNIGGLKFAKVELLPANYIKEVKSLLWVDFDNDGDKDLFVATAKSYNALFENLGGLIFKDITTESGLPNDTLDSYGACWGDYNRDGFLDLYYGERRVQSGLPNHSQLYRNNGNKTFTNVTQTTNTQDDAVKTPFCSSFIDYNNDKWPDLYTAHDRKRGNTMLKNNGDGTFQDVSIATNTDLKMDGMSVSLADYNNDGYQDIYVSNSEIGNALFVNQNGTTFQNKSKELGVNFGGVAWGTNFLDGDNDGDQDLYVSSMLIGRANITSSYFTNIIEQDTFLKLDQIPSDTVSSFNNAIGDFDNNGYPDIVVSNSSFPTALFINKGGQNNFIKIKLTGKLSNRDGIGSHLRIKTPDNKIQNIYTSCGTGFLGQNTNTQIIGIGNNTTAEVTITWPTGHIDRYNSLSSRQSYQLTEGETNGGKVNVDSDLILSLEEHDQHKNVLLYPNPSTGKVCIETKDPIKHFDVYDETGKLMNQSDWYMENDCIVLNRKGYFFLVINHLDNTKSFNKIIVH